MFSTKVTEEYLNADTLMEFNSKLASMIELWALVEVGEHLKPNTKLYELSVFNFKTIYSNSNNAQALRDFFFTNRDVIETEDFLFSRVLDLYVMIKLEFPGIFVNSLADEHYKTLEELGYDVDPAIAGSMPYGWLLTKIQYTIRYCLAK